MINEADLDDYFQRKIKEVIENQRRSPLPNQRAQKMDEKFVRLAFLMERDEQEEFIRLYAKHVVGVEVPDPIWQKNKDWITQIGQRLNGIGERPILGGPSFWRGMGNIEGVISERDKNWLIKHDLTGHGGFNLLMFMSFWNPQSPYISPIMTSIHAWK